MSETSPTRSNFSAGGLLTAADFAREQAYHLQIQATRCSSLHTWGVASGLDITVRPNGLSISISPGMAVDGLGRQILLPKTQDLDLSDQVSADLYLNIGLASVDQDWRIYPLGSGYVRIADNAVFLLSPTPPRADGQSVPLARLSFTPERRIAPPDLTVRRLCGLVVGRADLVPPEPVAGAPVPAVAMNAAGDALLISSPMTDLFGSLAISGAASVGLESPADTALAVRDAAPVDGAGAVSSDGVTIFGADAYDLAALAPGDKLNVPLTPGADFTAGAQTLAITAVSGQTVNVAAPPSQPLNRSPYQIVKGNLLRVRTDALTTGLEVATTGNVGVGGSPGAALLSIHAGDLLLDGGRAFRFLLDGSVRAAPAAKDQTHVINFLASKSVLEVRESGQIAFDTSSDPQAPPGLVLAANQNVGVGVSDPIYPLTVDGEIRASGGVIFADNSQQTAGVASVPIGTVVSWYSMDQKIPWVGEGFQLCDGSTITDPASPLVGVKTPDLRQMYVRGVTNYEQIGQAGGSATHTHAYTMAQHTHDMSHTHDINGYTTTVVGKAGDDIAGSSVSKNDHAHAISTNSNTCSPTATGPNSTVAPGATGPTADMPPYFTLLKAMRIR